VKGVTCDLVHVGASGAFQNLAGRINMHGYTDDEAHSRVWLCPHEKLSGANGGLQILGRVARK